MKSKEGENITVDFPLRLILKVVAFLFFVYLLFLAQKVVFVLFLSLILSAALEPWVDWLERKKIPRLAGVALIYLVLLIVFSVLFYLLADPLLRQLNLLLNNFPALWQQLILLLEQAKFYLAKNDLASQMQIFLNNLGEVIFSQLSSLLILVKNIFDFVIYFFLVLLLSFFILIERDFWQKTLLFLVPGSHEARARALMFRIKKKIGDWLKGQLTLCLAVFFLIYAGLSLLGVKYALLLALFSGIAEFIPLVGPLIGEIPAIFFAFFQSPILAVWVMIFYFIIQQTDANFLAPNIMGKALGLNPVIIILSILTATTLAGLPGILIAMPVAAILSIIIDEFFSQKQKR